MVLEGAAALLELGLRRMTRPVKSGDVAGQDAILAVSAAPGSLLLVALQVQAPLDLVDGPAQPRRCGVRDREDSLVAFPDASSIVVDASGRSRSRDAARVKPGRNRIAS